VHDAQLRDFVTLSGMTGHDLIAYKGKVRQRSGSCEANAYLSEEYLLECLSMRLRPGTGHI
jgi:hypothetical protein